jgi:SAM-dependent methyltransferase
MNELNPFLKEISGGRVLDVATGDGSFIHLLMEGLKDYDGITGIDSSPSAQAAFEKNFANDPKIHFDLMDAEYLQFEDGSLDTVCISNSLHHFERPCHVLNELLRVLKPGGTFILLEMYRDHQTETRTTHVLLHHWWAAVDRLSGIFHAETCTRAEIIEMVSWLCLVNTRELDMNIDDDDPGDPELIQELDGIIDRYITKADANTDLKQKGEELRKRVHTVGFQSAYSLLLIAQKPPER